MPREPNVHPTINFVTHGKSEEWLRMPFPGLNDGEIEKLADHLGEKLGWFTWYVEMPKPVVDDQAEREQRTGAHLLKTAKSMGWKDDGEGAQEFLLRRCREVAFEDCGRDPSADLRKIHQQMVDLYKDAANPDGGYAISTGALHDFILEIGKCLTSKT